MKKAAAEAKRQQRRRRGRASLISRTGGSGSLGILDYTPTASGLRPLVKVCQHSNTVMNLEIIQQTYKLAKAAREKHEDEISEAYKFTRPNRDIWRNRESHTDRTKIMINSTRQCKILFQQF